MKLHMVRDLSLPLLPQPEFRGEFVALQPKLHRESAEVFLDGYRDTVDYEGESLDETRAYLEAVFDAEHGPILPTASAGVTVDGRLASLILVSRYQGRAFISHVVTAKAFAGKGLAKALLLRAMEAARELGLKEIDLYVTDGNPSVALYERLGFVEVPGGSLTVELKSFLTAFEASTRLLANYVQQIPEATLDVRRLPDAWTIREHVYHVASLQPMLLGRLQTIAASPKAVMTPYNPESVADRDKLYPSVEQALTTFAELRSQQVALVKALPMAAWTHEAEHPEYTRYNLGMLLHHILFHENWHLYRIQELWLAKEVGPA
ncbi:MAG: GNAT family N-acetyltransferase [Spirochaetales bacterium]